MSLRPVLQSQYLAGLRMTRQAIDTCPEAIWAGGGYVNPSWQVVYHALFYTHFYLQASEDSFTPWELHRDGIQHMGASEGDSEPGDRVVPYTIPEMQAYCDVVRDRVAPDVDALDLDAAGSGFSWYPISKLEHQFVNLRHLQHHAGQISERVRQGAGRHVDWVGAAPQR
ncbi:MAG: DinB family protein [Candidatus Eisenbacteria bacterium]|nr:DinB family protein [Candidatus Eisenbacteria bacterium]